MEENKNKGLVIGLIICILLILGLTTFIICDKVISKDEVIKVGDLGSQQTKIDSSVDNSILDIDIESNGSLSIRCGDSNAYMCGTGKIPVTGLDEKAIRVVKTSTCDGGTFSIGVLTESGNVYMTDVLHFPSSQDGIAFSKIETSEKFYGIDAFDIHITDTFGCSGTEIYFYDEYKKIYTTKTQY